MLTDTDKSKLVKILQQDPEDLDDLFDEIDAIVSLYLINKEAAEEMPKRAKRKAELIELSKALMVILDNGATANQIFSGTEEYATLLASAAKLNQVLKIIVDAPSAHGPEPDDRAWLVDRLADLFVEHAGRQPTNTWNDLEGFYSSAFYDFCWVVLPDFSESALGATITKALALRKKDKKPQ